MSSLGAGRGPRREELRRGYLAGGNAAGGVPGPWLGIATLLAACLLAGSSISVARADIGPAAQPDSEGPAEGCKKGSESEGFWARFADSYRSHLAWDGPDATAAPPMVLGGAEIPESTPPWP